MTEHSFGGSWTDDKLNRLAKYLAAHRQIFTTNEKARHFTTWYVDAFAGTGSRSTQDATNSEPGLFDDVYNDLDTAEYRDGSALIALKLASPFDRYLFIDKSKAHVNGLKGTVETDHKNLLSRCTFQHGDANSLLRSWCGERNWKKDRAVVFLDPFGMQVEWSTIEALGATKAIDLWYLFPLGMGVMRLLTRDGKIDESWQKRLDVSLGTDGWRDWFYKKTAQAEMQFDAHEPLESENPGSLERDATEENIREFIEARLKGCFAEVAVGRVLRNSKSFPLYLLCFAVANAKGAPTALKIAQHILRQ